jgi:LmbE family N-acetylglucosaminyl deacetylase
LGFEAPEATNPSQQKELAEVRSHEAQKACSILGLRSIFFLDCPDRQVAESPRIAQQLAELLQQGNYQRVFCPNQYESHPDHQAAFHWLCVALRQTGIVLDVWCYEIWTTLRPNMHVPIDPTMAAKIEAAKAHASQLACHDYFSAFCGLAAYRALACPPSKYAEAFLILNSKNDLG